MASERVIIAGAGGISNAWFPPLREEGVTVAAVVDLDPERARAQVEKYGLTDVAIYADQAKAMAANTADFLLDLTIPDAHPAVTCAALEAGLPVIGEKPMAATLDQARRMVETSERTGKLYMVSQSRRWEPHHDSLARTVAAGRIGQLTALHCDFFLAAHFGGFRDAMDHPLILDMAVHHFDLARLFSGLDAVSVYAEEFNPAGSWYAGGAAADCWFEMAGGVRFNYRGSWCAEGCRTSWNGDWRVLGTRGTLLCAADQPPRGEVVAAESGFMRDAAEVEVVPSPLEHSEMRGALREMLRHLRTGERPQTECSKNLNSLLMVLAAVESSRRGRRVRLAEL